MTALIVIGIIIFVLSLLMFIPVYVSVDYAEDLIVAVKYSFIRVTLFPAKAKNDKQKRKDKKKDKKNAVNGVDDVGATEKRFGENSEETINEVSENEQNAESQNEQKEKEKALKKQKRENLIGAIKMVVDCGSEPMMWFFKKIRFRQIYINAVISGDDAAQAALNYGKITTLVWGVIGWLMHVVTVQVTDIDISCDFCGGKSKYDMHGDVGFRLGVFFVVGFWFLRNFIKYISINRKGTK